MRKFKISRELMHKNLNSNPLETKINMKDNHHKIQRKLTRESGSRSPTSSRVTDFP